MGLRDPYILYSGRLEGSKNVPLLLGYFIEYKARRPGLLKLALMGSGPEPIPAHPDIVSLGFRQGQAKLDAYAAASLLCQPSVNESFSIVIMEAWLSGVPVLVHADCEVTRYHAARSNGGLEFRNYAEFEAVLDLLAGRSEMAARMGANGRAYVVEQYAWPTVMRRFTAALEAWTQLPTPATGRQA
jgi:glycosyltransferase involved in cell wall biosynthesis